MNLQDLKYIVELDQVRHFGRAAERCFVSQPTLSLQLKKLEIELGVTLFERNQTQVIPTPIGEKIIEKARTVLASVVELAEIASMNPLSGTIKLGVIPTISPYFLPRVMPQLIRLFPQMKFVVIEEKTNLLVDKLAAGALDLCIAAYPLLNSTFEYFKIAKDPFFLALPLGHPLANNASISIADIPNDLLLLEEGHCLRDQALVVCNRPTLQESDYRGTSLETLRYMVASGLGCTLMPQMSLNGAASDISVVSFESPGPFRTIAGFWRKTSPRRNLLMQICQLSVV